MPLSPSSSTSLRRELLAKGKELAGLLGDLMAGKKPSGLDALDARPGETDEEKLRRYLGVIQARLDAIEAGTYGRCETCGEEIPLPELEELPWADRCRRCAAAGPA